MCVFYLLSVGQFLDKEHKMPNMHFKKSSLDIRKFVKKKFVMQLCMFQLENLLKRIVQLIPPQASLTGNIQSATQVSASN